MQDLRVDNPQLNAFSNAITSFKGEWYASPRRMLLLLPLLALYIAIAVIASPPPLKGDQAGYIENAVRILHIAEGDPAPHKHILKQAEDAGPVDPKQDLRLWWGPGYSAVLVPFIGLHLPWTAAKVLNGIFLFGAILYFYALISRYISAASALLVTLCLGLYPPLIRDVSALSPENLGLLLICGFMFHFCAIYNAARRYQMHLFSASLYLAFLAVTKVFFGYVITFMLAFLLISLLWRRSHSIQIAIRVFVLALICSVPYLLFTYHLTGKVFYWGTSGGMSLYWMSTPYPSESGSWFSFKAVKGMPELAPHRQFFAALEPLSDVERDEQFKKQALFNIAHYPLKYMANWSANLGRLLFSYPYSFTPQKLSTYFFILPNMFVVVLFVLGIGPALLRRRAIPFELWVLLLFALTAIGGSSLLSAYERQFMPLIPVLCVWLAFVYVRVLRIELRSCREISGFLTAHSFDSVRERK